MTRHPRLVIAILGPNILLSSLEKAAYDLTRRGFSVIVQSLADASDIQPAFRVAVVDAAARSASAPYERALLEASTSKATMAETRVLLHGATTTAADAPAGLSVAHIGGPSVNPEQLIGRIIAACETWRSRRRRRRATVLAGPLAFIVALLGGAAWRIDQLHRCGQIFANTESARLENFAAEATKVWVIGQSLTFVASGEREFLFAKARAGGDAEVRILLMGPVEEPLDQAAREVLEGWSPNSKKFGEQIDTSLQKLRTWARDAQAEGLPLVIKTTRIVPFSGNVIDWHDSRRAAAQERPQLWQVSSTGRPIFQFSRECAVDTFEGYRASLEAAWDKASPLSANETQH